METRMKALIIGAGMAAAAGLTMGAALHPDLRSDDRPEGPQTFALAGGPRSTGPFDAGMSLASYGGRVPDYVTGTDARRAQGWADERVAVAPSRTVPDTDVEIETEGERAGPAYARPVAYDPPPPEPAYPSLTGGRDYDDDSPPADDDSGPAVSG